MKKVILITAAVVITVGLYFFPSLPKQHHSNIPAGEAAKSRETNPILPRSREGQQTSQTGFTQFQTSLSTTAPESLKPIVPYLLGSAAAPPAMSPEIVLGKMRIAIHQYQSMFGVNPVGENSEITEALNGGNPKQARFISEESGLRINGRGELVDSWGTPFFFHQLSGTEMEIRSAGPDRKMWTQDDLITR